MFKSNFSKALLSKIFITLTIFSSAPFSLPAIAKDTSDCYSISDSDSKNACLAIAKKDTSYCYSINKSDTKNACLGAAKNDSS